MERTTLDLCVLSAHSVSSWPSPIRTTHLRPYQFWPRISYATRSTSSSDWILLFRFWFPPRPGLRFIYKRHRHPNSTNNGVTYYDILDRVPSLINVGSPATELQNSLQFPSCHKIRAKRQPDEPPLSSIFERNDDERMYGFLGAKLFTLGWLTKLKMDCLGPDNSY